MSEARIGGAVRARQVRVRDPRPRRNSLRIADARPSPARGRGRDVYTDAVVTPPSTTMVWPVMKVEASEAR